MSIQFKAPQIEAFESSHKKHSELIDDKEGFDLLAEFIKEYTGIHLPNNEKNRTLMAGRMGPLMSRNGLASYADLAKRLGIKASPQLKEEFISSITTNTTQFFRESNHYDVLKTYMAERMNDRNFNSHSFRVWCSACSSGQEAYSILFSMMQSGYDFKKHQLQFLATDIDLAILKKASRGVYSAEEVNPLPLDVRRHFSPFIGKFRISSELRELITFARFNLIQDKPNFKEKFDVIFCRNVLIYFEKEVSTAVIDMLISQLKPGGILFLGHVETGLLKNKHVQAISHAVYKKV